MCESRLDKTLANIVGTVLHWQRLGEVSQYRTAHCVTTAALLGLRICIIQHLHPDQVPGSRLQRITRHRAPTQSLQLSEYEAF